MTRRLDPDRVPMVAANKNNLTCDFPQDLSQPDEEYFRSVANSVLPTSLSERESRIQQPCLSRHFLRGHLGSPGLRWAQTSFRDG
ncbi:MAG: hypothetical protein CBE43_07735 [Rhodopirellula sp. TMED283]|nr:MAG: hypothetical protein CBE43_07735 [Rhodopirellula sp. TMED283]